MPTEIRERRQLKPRNRQDGGKASQAGRRSLRMKPCTHRSVGLSICLWMAPLGTSTAARGVHGARVVPSASLAKWVVMLGIVGAACGSEAEQPRAGQPSNAGSGGAGTDGDARSGAGTGGGAGAANGAGSAGRAGDASVSDTGSGSAIESGVSNGSPGSDIGTACARLAAANCARLLACSAEWVAEQYGSPTECVPIETVWCERVHAAPGVLGGVGVIDRLAAEAQSRSCLPQMVVPFHRLYTEARGTLPVDATCQIGPQCASGVCFQHPEVLGNCGRCVNVSDTVNAECAEGPGGLFCGGGLACNAGRCVVLPKAGERCIDGRCAPGHGCANGFRCDPLKFLGEDCDSAAEVCALSECDPVTRKCVARSGNAEGSACGGWPQSAGRCAAGLICVVPPGDGPGTCRAFSRLGAPCGWSCPSTTDCVNGTCAVPPFEGCG
jgi:hypothetical protein